MAIGNGGIGEMGKWGDGEMGKWGISAKTLKPQNPNTLTP
ncbi:hypothetical protein VL20_2538 [Microcystis panniformis FACHB-1757]|uniref:Uncharacterized protein n=1 Tax=Microcystis panniformis FACHB-1757 TaxID=1638788 RepID=A0A0K1S0Z4_9CHRO|nr:hypothetical protein VL20_2538 [Microcystis panniformis FACHB-1757]